MAQKNHTTNLSELLLQCVAQPDPMLSMLEWLCSQLMEAEVSQQLGAEKSERADSRSGYRCGYRPRRLDTRMGTMYLMVPKVRHGGYIPFFVTERKRSEAALIQVVQEAFVQGVSTRKMEKLAKSLGIESLSRSQVSEMTKGLNEQVNAFRSRTLSQSSYPILWVDALYEKVRMDGRIVSMAVLVVCGVDEHGQRDILAIEPLLEESEESYLQLFRGLQERGLCTPRLVVSDAHTGLLRRSAKASRGQAGNGARSISCAIFWRIFLTRTKRALARISRPSGWPPPESRPTDWPKKSAGSTSTVFPKPSAAWKMAWRTLCRFMLFHSWMQERFLPPTCWNG